MHVSNEPENQSHLDSVEQHRQQDNRQFPVSWLYFFFIRLNHGFYGWACCKSNFNEKCTRKRFNVASDILAVQLLLKESGCGFELPVAPLFETLDDLNDGHNVITTLLNNEWYRGHIKNTQNVMIGYSDSAKDAIKL